MDKSARMGTAPVGSLLFEFSLPATASMLVIAIYSLADRIFIGRGTGVEGIAAATAAFPFMVVGLAIGLLFAVGGRAVAAVALGAGNRERAREAVSRSAGAAFLSAAAAAVAMWFLASPLLSLFGASPRVAAAALPFVRILLVGLPFQAATMATISSLQVQGRPGASFALNLAGAILNIVLDPLFIFGFGWGLVGAAAATTLSQALGLAAVLAVVQGKRSALRIDFGATAPTGSVVRDAAAIGAPVFFLHLVSIAVLAVANNAIAPYSGDLGLAAIGVVNTVGMVVSYPLFGISNGAQPLFGYNFGAGRWGRIKRLSFLVGAWTAVFALAAEAVSVLAPGLLVGLFNDDAALAVLGSRALRIFMSTFALFPLSQLPAAYFQATGKPIPTGILMLSRSVAMIVGMVVLPLVFGLDGVFLSGPVSDALTAAVGACFLVRMGREISEGMKGEADAGAVDAA